MRSFTCFIALGFWAVIATGICPRLVDAANSNTNAPSDADKDSSGDSKAVKESIEAYKKIVWTKGPTTVHLGDKADFAVPAGYKFTDAAGARLWAKVNQNPPDDSLGVLVPNEASWFIEFRYDDIGHVKDDEKASFTPEAIDKILEECRASTELGNKERSKNGWAPLTIEGWEQKPYYDETTHHMMWAIRASSQGEPTVNYKCKLLGRTGVMDALLVGSPEELKTAFPEYQKLTSAVAFHSGSRYEEFRDGDKIAEYGLVGLITGTAAVVAVKMWKPIIYGIAAGFAAIGAVFKKIKNFFLGKKSQ